MRLIDDLNSGQQASKSSSLESDAFIAFHDKNRDGRLTLDDMESAAIQYFCPNSKIQNVGQGKIAERMPANSMPKRTNYSSPKRNFASKLRTDSPDRGRYYMHVSPERSRAEKSYISNDVRKSHMNYTEENYFGQNEMYTKDNFMEYSNRDSGLPSNTNNKRNEKLALQRRLSSEYGEEEIEKHLRYAKSIFDKYDADRNGFIDSNEIIPILMDTYKLMNVHYNPQPGDVKKFIEMMDLNHDGKIAPEEWEYFLLIAFERRKMNLAMF